MTTKVNAAIFTCILLIFGILAIICLIRKPQDSGMESRMAQWKVKTEEEKFDLIVDSIIGKRNPCFSDKESDRLQHWIFSSPPWPSDAVYMDQLLSRNPWLVKRVYTFGFQEGKTETIEPDANLLVAAIREIVREKSKAGEVPLDSRSIYGVIVRK